MIKIDVFGVKTKVQKGTKRSSGPKTDLFDQQKRGGGRAETKNAGGKKFSSFMWTLVAKNKKWPYRALYGPYGLGALNWAIFRVYQGPQFR